jgi:ABC-type nickel/cobalt efflux system permease component RcnA
MHIVSLLSVIALGFFLGMRHATDPDHVVAVTTIVARNRSVKHAALIGGLWGVGHTVTIIAVGGAIILLGWVIPARVGLSMEFSVGLMLILLGIMNLTGIMQWINSNLSAANFSGVAAAKLATAALHSQDASVSHHHGEVHSHAHSHGDYIHSHPHSHHPESHPHDPAHTPISWLDRHFGGIGLYQLARPLVVGLVHGLAGSAAVALLVLTTIRNPWWATAYLGVFGIGTIAGMMLITAAIGVPFVYAGKKSVRLDWGIRVASGLISLGFGLFIAYQIGFVNGLFGGHPSWTPR